MTEKTSYIAITGHGMVRLIPAAILLTIMALPVVAFYRYTGIFLANHHDWVQAPGVGGFLARFYENNFIGIIKNLHIAIRESGFLSTVGYIISTYLAIFIYLFIPPIFFLLFTKNRSLLAILTIFFWMLPILILGGFIYMGEIFSQK